MPIAVFGTKAFEVTQNRIYTFENIQYGSTLSTQKQDSSGKKPSTYNKGPGLNTLSISIKLDVSLGVNPRKEIEEWEAIKDAGIAYPFLLGGRPLGKNKWLLVSVQAIMLVIDNSGNVLSAELELKFDEYLRPGSMSASTSGGTYTPGIQLPPVSGDAYILSSDKSGLKRSNQNMPQAKLTRLRDEV